MHKSIRTQGFMGEVQTTRGIGDAFRTSIPSDDRRLVDALQPC